jgi:OOP family OmpA-OmpF porin
MQGMIGFLRMVLKASFLHLIIPYKNTDFRMQSSIATKRKYKRSRLYFLKTLTPFHRRHITMKYLFIFIMALPGPQAQAQDIKDWIERTAEQVKEKVTDEINQETDKRIDKAIEKTKHPGADANKKSGDEKEGDESGHNSSEPSAHTQTSKTERHIVSLDTYHKYNFITGEKILAFTDFKKDAIGDLPAQWNSSGHCEVETVTGHADKWAEMTGNGTVFVPEFIKNIPLYATIEFDLLFGPHEKYDQQHAIQLVSSSAKKGALKPLTSGYNSGVEFIIAPKEKMITAISYIKGAKDLESSIRIHKMEDGLPMHVAITRQGNRTSIYFDEYKAFDLPQGLPEAASYYLRFASMVRDAGDDETARMFVTRICYAAGKPDIRAKLFSEGKYTAHGITFNEGSADMRGESYGVLKEVAGIIKDNNLKIKITDYTYDGEDENKNQLLSEKRAKTIKAILTKEFNINKDQLTAAGKAVRIPAGETKAETGSNFNNRVEFVKQ